MKKDSRTRRTRTWLAILMSGLMITAMVGFGLSGAYFSNTKAGAITGSVGSIKVDTSNLSLSFSNLLPGEPQSVILDYQNTGTSPMDVWITFPNVDALKALNNLGTYGEVHILANGTELFASANLNDAYPNGTPGNEGVATIYNVPAMILLQSNVAANTGGSMTFTFAYASKLGDASKSSGGGVWNSYPLGATTNSGLPYAIVATQVGQHP